MLSFLLTVITSIICANMRTPPENAEIFLPLLVKVSQILFGETLNSENIEIIAYYWSDHT